MYNTNKIIIVQDASNENHSFELPRKTLSVAPKWLTVISGLQIFVLAIYLVFFEEDKFNSIEFIPKSILVPISWIIGYLFIFKTWNLKWTIIISGLQIFVLAIYLVFLEYGKIDVLPKSVLVFISWSVGCLFLFGVIFCFFCHLNMIYFFLITVSPRIVYIFVQKIHLTIRNHAI